MKRSEKEIARCDKETRINETLRYCINERRIGANEREKESAKEREREREKGRLRNRRWPRSEVRREIEMNEINKEGRKKRGEEGALREPASESGGFEY